MMMVRMKVFFVIGVGVAVPSILATATRTTLGQLKKCREAFSSMTKARMKGAPITAIAALAIAVAAVSASAQDIICCNAFINSNGPWIGASRIADCQGYFNSAPLKTATLLCRQRAALWCIDTSRCDSLDNGAEPPKTQPPGGRVSLPPADPGVTEGLEEGFNAPPAPPAGAVSPPRLVYLMAWPPGKSGKPSNSFKAWLDDSACVLPVVVATDSRSSAMHEVTGKLERSRGLSKVELRAREIASGALIGPVTGNANGEDALAVAAATRAALGRLGLVCGRP